MYRLIQFQPQIRKSRNCPKPYLLKLDVDGHELPILRGAEETLGNTSCVVIESPLCYLSERVSYLESKGFKLWDIVDLCYYCDNLHQVDLIFLSDLEKKKILSLLGKMSSTGSSGKSFHKYFR